MYHFPEYQPKGVISVLKDVVKPGSSMVDVGFGSGRVSFELYHSLQLSGTTGFDEIKEYDALCKDEYFWYENYPLLKNQAGCIEQYAYYCEYVKNIEFQPLPKQDFCNAFRFNYETALHDFVKTNTTKFDFVAMVDVLHYPSSGTFDEQIDLVKTLLKEDGVLLLTIKETDGNGKKQKLNRRTVVDYLNGFLTERYNQPDPVDEDAIPLPNPPKPTKFYYIGKH